MLSLFSRISKQKLVLIRCFTSSQLLQLQQKIQNNPIPSNELQALIIDVKVAILDSKSDLSKFQTHKTLGKLIQELNTQIHSSTFNEMMKLMNEVADLELPGDPQFDPLWKDLQELTLTHVKSLQPDALVNTLYYFTKMQQGSSQFYSILQKTLANSEISASQASRTLLAVVMSGEMDEILVKKLVGIIEQNISTLQEKAVYYVAMTLPQPGFHPFLNADLVVKTQKKCQEYLGAFDLLQLSQIMTAFQNTALPEFVIAYEQQIKEALENFKKYKDKIKIDSFLGDLIRNFGSAAYCVAPLSSEFWKEAETVTSQNLHHIPDDVLEMLMISFLRCRIFIKPYFASELIQEVLMRNLIQDKKVNELSILSFLTEYRIENQKAYFQLAANVVEELQKGTQLNVPLDILAIIAFSFARRFGPSEEPRVMELYKLLVEHIDASKDKAGFSTIANLLSFLGNAELKEEKLKTRFQDQLQEMDFQTIQFGVEEFLTLLSILIQGEMFNEKLWEKAYEAVEAKIEQFQRLEFIRLFVTCSQLGLARPQLWQKVKLRVSGEINLFTNEELLEMHNCIAIEELEIPGFWEKVKKLLHQDLPLPEFVNLGWSIVKIQDKDPEFWKAYETKLMQTTQEISLYDLQNILLAMRKNTILSSQFWNFIRAKIKERIQEERNVSGEIVSTIIEELKAQDAVENGPLLVELQKAYSTTDKAQ